MENNHNKEFYIGWQAEAPFFYARRIKKFILIVGLALPLIAAAIVFHQSGFATSSFERGKPTTLEGILVKDPVPFLQVYRGKDIHDQPVFQYILLVGKGKHGAWKALNRMESENKYTTYYNKSVQLRGELIYHDGKTLLELDGDPEAIKEVAGLQLPEPPSPVKLGSSALLGEITDPKCLFGVMKPGFGKPHRSCAARCIAGGIPPVLKTRSSSGATQYYLLTGAAGQPINDRILPFVADQVAVCGEVVKLGDWLVIQEDEEKKIARIPRPFSIEMAMCH